MAEIKTVKMWRDEPAYPGGPVLADVHPSEVENWQAHGWRIAKDAPAGDNAPSADAETVVTVADAVERAASPRRKGK